MLIFKSMDDCSVTKVETGNNDVLFVKYNYKGFNFALIGTYFDTKDTNRNSIIMRSIGGIIENLNEKQVPIILMGDFNAHIGVVGEQSINNNGQLLLEFQEKHNLILLNGDLNCRGETTWSRGNQKSAIDFFFCSQDMYKYFTHLFIDEDKELYDLSDHHMLEASFCLVTGRVQKRYTNEYKEIVYLKINEETKQNYRRKMECWITNGKNTGKLSDFHEAIKIAAKSEMERTIKKKLSASATPKEEPIWFNSNIKKEISKRRQYNKKVRKATNENERNELWKIYLDQKWKTQRMIKEAIWEHEKKLTEKIKLDMEGRKLWEHIKKLKGDSISQEVVKIYDENGEELKGELLSRDLECFWKTIYQRHGNDIKKIWHEKKIIEYEKQIQPEQETKIININDNGALKKVDFKLREHLDAAIPVPHHIVPMKDHEITLKEVQEQIKRAKEGKSPGPDGIKIELIKALQDSNTCLLELTKCYNEIIRTGVKESKWSESNTKLISKMRKPTVEDLRPIALTDVTYKLFMGILKEKVEHYLKQNGLINELQAGFTRGRRITDNLFLLQHCVERTFLRHKQLIIISVDFKKAFDSILRCKLIKTLMEMKIDKKIIDIIAEIYTNDITNLYINDKKIVEMEVTSGIRQGCNGSTVFFLLITYGIIKNLQETNMGYIDNIIKIVALFFADDGLMMASTIREAETMIKALIKSAEMCGLSLNKEKSKILMYNSFQEIKDIEDIEVVEQIKYLGVTVTNKRRCFDKYKKETIEKARRFAKLSQLWIEVVIEC